MIIIIWYVINLSITILWINTPDHIYNDEFKKSKIDAFLATRCILGAPFIGPILFIHLIFKVILGEPLTNKQLEKGNAK